MIIEKLNKYSAEIQDMFLTLKNLLLSVAPTAQEKLWAGLPSYYVGNAFVRLIPFKDHINIEASSLVEYKLELSEYKFSPKNMLQIYIGQTIPTEILQKAFLKCLHD